MRDAEGISCSVIYGQDNRSSISHETSRVLFVAYAPPDVPVKSIEAHFEAIKNYIYLFSPTAQVEGQDIISAQASGNSDTGFREKA